MRRLTRSNSLPAFMVLRNNDHTPLVKRPFFWMLIFVYGMLFCVGAAFSISMVTKEDKHIESTVANIMDTKGDSCGYLYEGCQIEWADAPSRAPTMIPTILTPTREPTVPRTYNPTVPTRQPTLEPTRNPTNAPTTGTPTTLQPTRQPTTIAPTGAPTTLAPSTSSPTSSPTMAYPCNTYGYENDGFTCRTSCSDDNQCQQFNGVSELVFCVSNECLVTCSTNPSTICDSVNAAYGGRTSYVCDNAAPDPYCR